MNYQFHASAYTVFGRDSRKEVGARLKKWGVEGTVLLIHGQNTKKAGLTDDIAGSITDAGLSIVRFEQVQPDAPVEAVRAGVAFAREYAVSAIVAIGGGSAIDMAKAIAAMLDNPGDILDYAGLDRFPNRRSTVLFAIPSTCGTGSEITDGGVIYDAQKRYKFPVWDMFTAPDVAVLDPYMLDSLSSKMIAATAMDAMAHSVEAYTSKGANPISDALAIAAVEIIARNLPAAASHESQDALEQIQTASTMAGMAFNRSGVHTGHAIAHAIGAISHMHHGAACALALPYVVQRQAAALPDKVRKLGAALGLDLAPDLPADGLGTAVAAGFARMNAEAGIGSLSSHGVTEDMLDAIVDYAVREPNQAKAPVPADAESLHTYLKSIL